MVVGTPRATAQHPPAGDAIWLHDHRATSLFKVSILTQGT